MNASPEVHGRPPAIAGTVCEELWCQQHWHRGELADELNVIFLLAAGAWHRLALDGGVIFWRENDDAPAPLESPETGDSYKVGDLGTKLGVRGCRLARYEMRRIAGGGTEVVFYFSDGPSVAFRNIGDRTSLADQQGNGASLL